MQVKSTDPVLNSILIKFKEKLPINSNLTSIELQRDSDFVELICEIFRVCEKQLDSTLELLAGQLEVLTNLVETPADSIKKQQSICIVLRVMMYSFAYYWMGKSNTDGESLPMLSLPLYSSNLIGPLGSENAKSPTSARSQNLPALPTLSASSKVFGATKKLAELPPLASLKADAVIQAIQVHLADIDASIESLPYSWNTDAIQHSLFRERHIYFYRTAFANKTLKSVAFLVFEHINDHKPTLNKMIETAAARNLFFMSTSNWQTVFNYIQTHLVGWMKVEKTKVAQNSIQNQAVFYSYLEGCNINQERLVDILEDAQKLISMDLTDQAQGEMALVLANVIRSWILDYPDQFHGLWKTKLNILSSMDKLLDYFNECLESKKKKTIFIPLISGLFLISPADTMEITLAAGGSSKKKKHPYTTIYELLRRPGKGKFGFDVSFYCHIDLLRATLATVDNNAITWVNTFFSDLLDASLKEVKEKIFDVTKPVLSSKDEETFITERNIQMYICYLLEFDQTARAMLVRVLDNTYPASFKSLVINGMLNVWLRVGQISVKLRDSKFDRLAFVSMRTLFSYCCGVKKEKAAIAKAGRGQPLPSMEKDKILTGDEHSRIAIIKSALLFWRENPEAALFCETGHLEEKDFRKLLTNMRTCFIDFNGPCRTLALTFIAAIFDPSVFIKWAADIQSQSYGKFWRMHSYTVSMLSRDAINLESHQKCVLAKELLSLCCQLFKVQSAVMNIFNVSYLDTFSDVHEKYQVVANFEMAFICLVTSQDYNVSRLSVAAMNCFLQCISTTENMEENVYISYDNLDIYSDFVKKFGQLYWSKVFSSKAHQKRIRNMLKSLPVLTIGIIGAWEEMLKRWRVLCNSLIPLKNSTHNSVSHTSLAPGGRLSHTSSYGSLNELGELPTPKFKGRGAITVKTMMMDNQHTYKPQANIVQPQDYYNVAGLLICITNLILEVGDGGERQQNDSRHSSMFSLVPTDRFVKDVILKDLVFTEESSVFQYKFVTMEIMDTAKPHLSNSVNYFIDELVALLLNDNVQAREMISEILGYDISGMLCVNMCKLWCRILQDQIAEGPDVGALEKETLVAETILFIAAAILSRTEDILTSDKGLSRLEKNSVPLDNICALLTKWVNNVATPTEQQEKIKAKISNLTVQLMQRSHIIGIKQEISWRNEILEAVVEWSGIYRLGNSQKFDFENRKTFEFNMNLQKCMTCLLKDLPVNKSSDNTTKTSLVGEDDAEIRSNLFFKYFRFFLKALDVVKSSEYSSKYEMEQFKFKQQHVSLFKSEIISALSNLISANMDVGIRQTLSIAYSQDPMLRGVIINVIKNVLKVGSSGSLVKALEDHEFDPDAKYSELLSLMFDEPFLIISGLAATSDFSGVEEFVSDVLELSYHTGQSMKFMTYLVKLEVSLTDDVACIFRRTSLTTRVLAMFSRKEAAEFLQRALAVPLKKAIAENSDKGFEIDPARVDNPSNLDANLKNVEALLQIVFDSIIDGADAILSGMRVILFNISKYVNMRFPGKGNMAVGALLILRLVTPAILTPDLYDLVKSPITNRNLKRGLLIVGKIIQNLANGVKFGSKESHMISFNTFLDKNKERYENFILSLITLDESANAQFNHKTTENSAFLSGARVHHVINKKLGELEKLPQSENFRVVDFIAPAELDVFDPSTVGQVINISIGGKWTSMFEKLSGALKNCGPAPDVEKCVKRMAEQSKSPEKKENILVSTKTRATSPGTAAPIQNLKDSRAIYISLKNKSKPALYYIARKVNMSETDENSLKLFIINEIKMYLGAPMDVFVDLTLFSEENEWSEAMLECFDPLLSQDSGMGMQNLILINPNTHFLNCCKKYARLLSPPKLNHKVEFVTSLKELTTYVPEDKIDLPAETLLMLEGKGVSFTGGSLIRKKKELPITMYVCPEVIYLMYPKKQEFGSMSVPIIDAILITSVTGTGSVTDSDDRKGTEFFVKTASAEWRFTNSQKENILQHIDQMVSLATLVAFKGGFEQRQLNAEDLPGILLNIAFYNICSEHGALRTAGLELLIALESSRDRKKIDIVPTTAMPLNNEDFIIRISSQIAAVDTNIVYEFLLECLRGYSEYSVRVKHMSLLYMEPWINCLNSVEPRSEAKIVEVLDSLVKILTIRENEDFTFLVQAKFWRLIGAHKQFVDILLPKIVNAAKANTLDSKQNDMLISVVIAMIPEGQVVPALFNLGLQIYSDALKAENVSKLVESSHWKSISIINRILANVSFDFHIPWETYFGQLLYFVMISIGCGSHVERRAIQVILHNAFHQLYSKFESPAIVRGIVYLVDPKNLNLFGQSGAISTSDQFSLESFPLKQFDTDPVYDGMNSSDLSTSDLSNFTELVLDIIKNGHDDPKVLEMWKSSFAQLFSSNAFSSYNLAPDRLFLPLSYCLKKLDAEIFKKFSQVIVQEFSTDLKTKAVASVLHCLNFLFKKGLEDEELVGPLFWMCLGLMQFGHLPVFRHCLNLFHQILVKMSPFNFKTVSEYSSKLEPASSALDAESKLSPKKSFNLYLSAILLRGLSDLSTSNTTRECLNLLLSLSVDCKLDTSESISYIVLLAPTETLPKLFASAGLIKDNVDEEDQILLIDKLIEILQKQSQPVMVAQISMLTLMLDHWKTEDDLLVLCRIFARLAEIFPTVLNTIATKLSPRLLKLSSDSKLQSISAYIEIVSKQLEKTSKNTSIADFDTILANAGMEGLFAEASFDRLGTEALKTRAKLVAGFVNAIKSLQ